MSEMETENIQKFAYEIQGNSAVIWRCFSRAGRAEIPEKIEGYPVTALAPYAFSAHLDEKELDGKYYTSGGARMHGAESIPALCGERLEELILPGTVAKVGKYCFYNCHNLKKIEFSGDLRDWGSGAFTGCHRVRYLTVRMREKEESALREVLQELPEEMQVDYYYENSGKIRYARLIFPEFFEEGVENTPARILVTHVHGSGLYYRNCFRNRTFLFSEYDGRFPYAAVQEDFCVLAELVESRLRFPCQLAEEAKVRYLGYLWEKREDFGTWFVKKKDIGALTWFLDTIFGFGETGDLLGRMTELAVKYNFAEGVSCMMDYRRRFLRPQKKKFEL